VVLSIGIVYRGPLGLLSGVSVCKLGCESLLHMPWVFIYRPALEAGNNMSGQETNLAVSVLYLLSPSSIHGENPDGPGPYQ
jgi:hypothetical protein